MLCYDEPKNYKCEYRYKIINKYVEEVVGLTDAF
jgi:hypothetical protein